MIGAEKKGYSGICSSCRHAPTCCYLQEDRAPIIQCEEFEPFESPPPHPVPATRNAGEEDWRRIPGLCGSCEHRDSCMYTKPEGGVWHCDEYE